MKITLTGATGFIGRHMISLLVERGDQVTVLSRGTRPGTNPRYLKWDARSAPPEIALDADAVIHLAGENVAQRWTPQVKQRIRASRIESTRALVRALQASRSRPAVLISASAIGIYGSRGDERLTERVPPGEGFLEEVCVEWERESQRAGEFGVRVVNPRIGIVLGPGGGALERMLTPFKAGVGGRIGSGRQWMSWIHIADLSSLILFALDHAEFEGALNATAPNPVTNATFTADLGHALHRPTVFAVPLFALRLLFGEMAGVITASQRVVPEKAVRAGFEFRFPHIGPALENVLGGR